MFSFLSSLQCIALERSAEYQSVTLISADVLAILNGAQSRFLPVLSGVPQGTVLGTSTFPVIYQRHYRQHFRDLPVCRWLYPLQTNQDMSTVSHCSRTSTSCITGKWTGTALLTNEWMVHGCLAGKVQGTWNYLERKFQGTNGPRNECCREWVVPRTKVPSWEQMFQGTSPVNECSSIHLANRELSNR